MPRVVAARAKREGRVAIHRLTPEESRIPTVLVRRRDAFVSTALGRFIEMATEHFDRVRKPRAYRESPEQVPCPPAASSAERLERCA